MSNPSLREQLAALAKESATGSEKSAKSSQPAARPARKDKKQPVATTRAATPAWLEQARYGVELLKVCFPQCFGERETVRPLKTGIRQDLVKQLGTMSDIAIGDKACMVSSLAYYVNSVVYHKSVVEGADRVGLEGNIVGKVTAEEAQYSRSRLEARAQKRQSGSQKAPQANPKRDVRQEEPL